MKDLKEIIQGIIACIILLGLFYICIPFGYAILSATTDLWKEMICSIQGRSWDFYINICY